MEASRDWLDQFPAEQRGAIANWFYNVVRVHHGKIDPRQGCSEVYREQARQLQRYGQHPGHGVNKLTVIRAMQKDPNGAQAFFAWVVAQEARSPEQRAQDKTAAEAEGKRRYMEGQPPTQKQLHVLAKLGVREQPENRWQASVLIEQHRTW